MKNSAQNNFNFLLKDFEQDNDPKTHWTKHELGFQIIKENKIQLPAELSIRHPFIIFIIFVNLKGFRFYGKLEKVAWTIYIKYKGKPFILTHRKFGFYIISNEENEEVNNLGINAMQNIIKAIPMAEALFTPEVKNLVNKGDFSMNKEFTEIPSKEIKYYEPLFRYDVNNKLKVVGNKTEVARLMKYIEGTNKLDNGTFARIDFGKIIPLPARIRPVINAFRPFE